MNSRERILTALAHREADHVPFDLGGSDVTGIHRDAYRRLMHHLGLDETVTICEMFQQVALPDESLLERLKVDTRAVFPNNPDNWQLELRQEGPYRKLVDEWGVEWATPLEGGLYYDMVVHPLAGIRSVEELAKVKFPQATNPGRFAGLRELALEKKRRSDSAIVLMPPYGGMFESAFWLRGYEQFFLDLGGDSKIVETLLDKTLEFRLEYWAKALETLGDLVDVVVEYEDLGHTTGSLISPRMYRQYLKPRHKQLFSYIKNNSHAAMFLHSCGAIYTLIPDMIEAGIDILNPIQVGAKDMGDTLKLKQAFGRDITFWGGGVNTQTVLPHGTPQQVKDEVKRRIDDLAPGGGYVFSAVHNIQPDVPPENLMAMWEAWQEYGWY